MLLAHAPAGYLLTRFLARTVFKESIDPKRSNRLYQVVMFAGLIGAILPDIDFIYISFLSEQDTTPLIYKSYANTMDFITILVVAGK
jgi:hypothetical protein